MIADIAKCARCGGEHLGLEFKPLTHPMAPADLTAVVWSEWAPCPTNGEPIMFAFHQGGHVPEVERIAYLQALIKDVESQGANQGGYAACPWCGCERDEPHATDPKRPCAAFTGQFGEGVVR